MGKTKRGRRGIKREVWGVAADARETGAGNARVNRWDGGFDGLKRIREASGNKRGSWKGKGEEERSGTIEGYKAVAADSGEAEGNKGGPKGKRWRSGRDGTRSSEPEAKIKERCRE